MTTLGNKALAKLTIYNIKNFSKASSSKSTIFTAVLACLAFGTANAAPHSINPKAISMLQARLAGLNFLNNGADMIATRGMDRLQEANTYKDPVFGAVGGGDFETETGSSISVRGYNFLIGFAGERAGLEVSIFYEGSTGKYKTTESLQDGSTVKADGKHSYQAVGLMGKNTFENRWYVDGGFRYGDFKYDFHSSEFINAGGNQVEFKQKNKFYGFNAGVGKIIEITPLAKVIPFTQVFYTRAGGNNQAISGENYELASLTSLRPQMGTRLQYDLAVHTRLRAKLAWEGEVKGEAQGKYEGIEFREQVPSLQGNTYLLGMGMRFLPNKNSYIDIDFSGAFGQRKGMGIAGSASFEF